MSNISVVLINPQQRILIIQNRQRMGADAEPARMAYGVF
ncbi:hypothetical protein MNBD_GAMMA11-2864 [hydrothermal vent metagenome]|uniref:Uncharacterized protein n=1 Tax=hydrothermal vent metagenome TaxID=652676 RepID=A0A3B0XUN6_9ZZZZ